MKLVLPRVIALFETFWFLYCCNLQFFLGTNSIFLTELLLMMCFVLVCSVMRFLEMHVRYYVKFCACFSVAALPPFFQWGRVKSVHKTCNTKKSKVLPIGM